MLKTLTQKIVIILITIIMVSNFIMPNYVQAESAGEKLVNAFFHLIAKLGDVILSTMQLTMKGVWDLEENNEYAIKYSPGMIFADEVPALDINFISPGNKKTQIIDYDSTGINIGKESTVEELFNKAGMAVLESVIGQTTLEKDVLQQVENIKFPAETKKETLINIEAKTYKVESYYETKQVAKAIYYNNSQKGVVTVYYYYAILYDDAGIQIESFSNDNTNQETAENLIKNSIKNKVSQLVSTHTGDDSELQKIKNLKSGEKVKIGDSYVGITRKKIDKNEVVFSYTIYKQKLTEKGTSTAAQLQSNISTWYQGLRTIALVGLLSVLVYVGIRIILSSSSAQDKAKYKNMLKDWLVAICILFVLHYIMAFMLGITGDLNNIIKTNVIGESTIQNTSFNGNKIDKLMSDIRTKVGDYENSSSGETAGYTIMYLALVILTLIFTLQYLKRVVFMAFLTMIAPMIALTYPLDKIKDGKAQAFSYWLREYIFNCLIQPVHLLLYAVLIGSAMTFATENMLYAIAALAFMVPAEKFIKEMFGMKSQSPTSQLGAAAGGAMVMSMLNKIKAKPPKDGGDGSGSGSSSGGSNRVRTATRNGGGASSSGSTGGSGSGGSSSGSSGSAGAGTGGAGASSAGAGGAGSSSSGGISSSSSGGLGSRINAAAKKNIYGVDALKSHGKKFSRALGGAALGGTAGTIALATQIATGDILENPGNALGAIGGATAVGYHAGSNFVGSSFSNIKNLAEGAKKIAYGEEAYSNRQFDKKFFSSEGYKTITEDSSIDQTNIKARTQEFLDNGITDVNDIRKALQSGVSGDEYKAMTNMGMDKKDISAFAKIKGKKAARGLGASEIAARMQIAKNLPPQLYKDEKGFVRFAKRYGIDEKEAKKLFANIDEFA